MPTVELTARSSCRMWNYQPADRSFVTAPAAAPAWGRTEPATAAALHASSNSCRGSLASACQRFAYTAQIHPCRASNHRMRTARHPLARGWRNRRPRRGRLAVEGRNSGLARFSRPLEPPYSEPDSYAPSSGSARLILEPRARANPAQPAVCTPTPMTQRFERWRGSAGRSAGAGGPRAAPDATRLSGMLGEVVAELAAAGVTVERHRQAGTGARMLALRLDVARPPHACWEQQRRRGPENT